jgi:TolA-binding protein
MTCPAGAPAAKRKLRLATTLRWAGVLAFVCWAGPALASNVNGLRAEIADLEQLAKNLEVQYRPETQAPDQLAEHRLVDAQVLYSLKDYTRAAILLYDYITKFKSTPGYPDAIFYLADSLYHKRNFLSARRYYQKIADQIRGRYYQEALQRLVELALHTGDHSNIRRYFEALDQIPQGQLKSSVAYVKGKYYYFNNQTDAAVASFNKVPAGQEYYMQAQYFVGACLVRKNDHAGATRVFQSLLRTTPASEAEQHLRDLTYLAIGRLLYSRNQISDAIGEYQKVSRRSKEFDASLYEISWAYIKANEYQRALRALELLILAKPDSSFVPEVKVLQGNLMIRLQSFSGATDLFEKTRERFLPINRRMRQVMEEHGDPNVFFDLLLSRNLAELAIRIQMPQLAVRWVQERKAVKRALNLVRDVREISASVKELDQLVVRLERAIGSPAKIKIFPEFARAKARSLEVDNRIALARRQIIGDERSLVSSMASASEKQQLSELQQEREGYERILGQLPTRADTYKQREKASLARLGGVGERLAQMAVMIDSLRAQLVAAEKYFSDTVDPKNKLQVESFRRDARDRRREITELQQQLERLRQAATDARDVMGVGGARELAERTTKDRYRSVTAKEHLILVGLRGRLGQQQREEFDTLTSLLSRCELVEQSVQQFNRKLDQGIEVKLVAIRQAIDEERRHLGSYRVEADQTSLQTNEVAGGITYRGFQAVARRFYEIVVRADVGIIDVAWALKDDKTKEVSRLVRQQKRELKLLDQDFREVLNK